MPEKSPCYISNDYVDVKVDNTGIVKANRVNVRTGPGLNYSVLLQLSKTDMVTVVDKRGDWLKIDAPEGAFGWVFSKFIKYYSTEEEFFSEEKKRRKFKQEFADLEKSYQSELSKSPSWEKEFEPFVKAYQKIIDNYPHTKEAGLLHSSGQPTRRDDPRPPRGTKNGQRQQGGWPF